jgi:hypothetical protein
MTYIRTRLATGWPEKEPFAVKVMYAMLFFIPRSNPDYDKKMHLLHEWLVEFDESGLPDREIGLDANGKAVLAGPDARNYGFWLDTNMRLQDFKDREEIDGDKFNACWNEFFSGRPYLAV